MFVRVQAILKEFLDFAGSKLRGRQADIVNHKQGDDFAFGADIEVRRRAMSDAGEPSCSAVQLHRKS
ncbi:hypothetical protein D3C77_774040 [compost metagenome]